MTDIWFISDTHFCHDNILKFEAEGKLIRPEFANVEEMNEFMIHQWNDRIKPQDKVYHLGDVACGVRAQSDFTSIMHRLHGHKRLIIGNHDHIQMEGYKSFDTIELWTGGKFKQYGFVCSHIPLREDSMRDGEFNVHGHIHQNPSPSRNHICVCVEQTNYRPVHLEEIKSMIEARRT